MGLKWITIALCFILLGTAYVLPMAVPDDSKKESYNILIALPFGSKSHMNVFEAVAEELVTRGHKVTTLSTIKDLKSTNSITHIYLEKVAPILHGGSFTFFQAKNSADLNTLFTVFDMQYQMGNLTYHSPEFQEIFKNPRDPKTNRPKFDVLIVDVIFNDCVLPIAHYLDIPIIYFSPAGSVATITWSMNVPYPFSYVPAPIIGPPESGNVMNFRERANTIVREVLPDAPPLLELQEKTSFYITHSFPGLHVPQPSMPNVRDIACLQCKPAKSLPKDLEDFMQSSGQEGAIYFSLGSYTKGASMPMDMLDKLLEAFRTLPQKILFKYENDIDNLPKNIKLTKWAPQQDLLAHPKLRLFITHGGGLSTLESVYHGTPILGFPLSADQHGNMATAVRAGFAEHLDWRTFTTADLKDKITKILQDSKYKERAQFWSELLKDQPHPPVESAAYWIEYVIRHKGAPHLQNNARHLNFFQYFLLDIIGVCLVVLLAVVALLVGALKLCCKLLCRFRKCDKTKKIQKLKKH